MRRISQASAPVITLKMFLSSDHVSAATSKTVAITISKNGGAFANPNAGATNATEISNGWYKVTLNATDTGTLGDLIVRGTATACDDSEQISQVVDAATGGFTNLDATVSSRLAPTTAGRTLDVSTGGEAGLDWANIGSPTTTVGLSGTTVKTATDVETDTQDIQSRLPAALVSGRIDASVGAMAANTLTATAIAADAGTEIGAAVWATTPRLLTAGTNIVLAKGTGVTGFNDLDAAEVRAAVGLASANLDTQLDALPTNAELATALGTADDAVLAQVALVKAVTDKLDDTVEDDGGTFRFTTNALEQAPSGTGASAATIADAVWDEVMADHVAAGSFGLGIDAVPTAIENADALLDRSNGIETGWTFRQASRIVLAVLGGKASGMATTTAVFRDVGDTKNRVTATVDSSGNRTAVTLDGT